MGATAVRALASGSHAPEVLSGTAERLMAFLDYFAGVFTLLSLTAAVLCGLAATDRLVLTPRLRVAAQSVHRATAVAAVGFLVIHIAVKVAESHASPLAAILPFGGGATFAVGLGTLAADLLVLAAATGAVRGRFADSRRPWLWRVLHASAYACWPIALAHGLTAGRAAAVWVLWSYGASAALVALALLVRALGLLDRRPNALRLRAYAARRPSRVTLAGLDALAREHEPVPYAAHAAAQTPAPQPTPDRPREHPLLPDTPPHGIPVQTAFASEAPARPRAGSGRHAAGASAKWAAAQAGQAAAGREHAMADTSHGWTTAAPTSASWGGAAEALQAAAPDWAATEASLADGTFAPAGYAGGQGHGWAMPTQRQAPGTLPRSWNSAPGGAAPAGQAGPYDVAAAGPVAAPQWATPGAFPYAEEAAPAYATAQAPGPGSYYPGPWGGGWQGSWQAPGHGWAHQPFGADMGPGWTSVEASGEWGPLTWDMPAAGGSA